MNYLHVSVTPEGQRVRGTYLSPFSADRRERRAGKISARQQRKLNKELRRDAKEAEV